MFPCWLLNVPGDEKLQNWGKKSVWKDGIGSRVGASVTVCVPFSGTSAPGFAVVLHCPLCFMLGSFSSTCREPGSILSALWEQQHRGCKSLSWYSQVFFCAFPQALVEWLKSSQMLMMVLEKIPVRAKL